MPAKLTWLGHGSWSLVTGGHRILIDPFLDDCPAAPVKSDKVAADFILVSHGHFDHVADAAKIAQRTGAKVISNFEICQWLGKQGVKNTDPHNLGGGTDQPFGRVELTLAFHSSQLPDGSDGGNPSGFLLLIPEGNIYFACDTGLFGDMKLIGERGLTVAVLPIGDRYTMGPDAALRAVELLGPRHVLPSHYNTWPPIAQDPNVWAKRVQSQTEAIPHVLGPGDSFEF